MQAPCLALCALLGAGIVDPSKPPASSAIWMVHRETLNEAGVGLPNYGLSVRPGAVTSSPAPKRRQYFYVVGSRQLGVAYENV